MKFKILNFNEGRKRRVELIISEREGGNERKRE